MKNKITIYNIRLFLGILVLGFILGACEDYLDKAPEATLTDKDVYGNFISYQGFVEEMYACICDPHKALSGNIYHNMLMADEVLSNVPLFWDDGNYWYDQSRFLTTSSYTISYMLDNNQTMPQKDMAPGLVRYPEGKPGFDKSGLDDRCNTGGKEFYRGAVPVFQSIFPFGVNAILWRAALYRYGFVGFQATYFAPFKL